MPQTGYAVCPRGRFRGVPRRGYSRGVLPREIGVCSRERSQWDGAEVHARRRRHACSRSRTATSEAVGEGAAVEKALVELGVEPGSRGMCSRHMSAAPWQLRKASEAITCVLSSTTYSFVSHKTPPCVSLSHDTRLPMTAESLTVGGLTVLNVLGSTRGCFLVMVKVDVVKLGSSRSCWRIGARAGSHSTHCWASHAPAWPTSPSTGSSTPWMRLEKSCRCRVEVRSTAEAGAF